MRFLTLTCVSRSFSPCEATPNMLDNVVCPYTQAFIQKAIDSDWVKLRSLVEESESHVVIRGL